jgi:hypothetical protein
MGSGELIGYKEKHKRKNETTRDGHQTAQSNQTQSFKRLDQQG